MLAHNMAYKIMMVTGIGVSLLNLNPLIKLDGYYIFSEIIGKPDLKESASAYLSGWTRKRLFGMPAELEYVPRGQRPFYLIYALLSELYGFALLTFMMVFTYNILKSYSPAWAFLPSLLVGYWVFRGRIHDFEQFLKLFYLDKKERILSWLKPLRIAGLGISALLLLLLPIWPDFEEGPFVLEPVRQASVHSSVGGKVSEVFVNEGQRVVPGGLLATLENLDLQSDLAKVRADLLVASARAMQNRMRYANFAGAERERIRLQQEEQSLIQKAAKLRLTSPISGVVATPRLSDLRGTYLDEGTTFLELVDDSESFVRIYVPEFAMHDIRVGMPVRLRVRSRLLPVSGTVRWISADSVPLDPSLGEKEQLAGINPPRFFVAEAHLDNNRELHPGMTGMAKIRVGRRSICGRGFRFVRELVARRLW
jgi:putative peptide zinc metalloprotease protein